MNHLTIMIMQTRPKTSQNLKDLTACLICQINVTANDPTGDGINSMKDETLYPLALNSGAELYLDPTDTVKMVELHDECSGSHDAIHHSGWHTQHLCTWREETQTVSQPYEGHKLEGQVVLGHLLCKDYLSQIFTNGLGCDIPYPLARKGDASLGLD